MKFKKLIKLWTVLSATTGALLAVSVIGTNLGMAYYGNVNNVLGINDTVWEKPELAEGEAAPDTEYFKSDYGPTLAAYGYTSNEISKLTAEQTEAITKAQEKLIEATYEQVRNEAREGTALMLNEKNALPLKSNERKVTLFGYAAGHINYTGGGGATSALSSNKEVTIDLKEALEGEGFTVNNTVYDMISKGSTGGGGGWGGGGGGNSTDPRYSAKGQGYAGEWNGREQSGWTNAEWSKDDYEGTKSSWSEYSDVAIVVLSRNAGEGADQGTYMQEVEGLTVHQLDLTKRERDMFQMIKESNFGKVIVLLNSPWQIEVGDLTKEYGIDAMLYIGLPGVTGLEGVAEILVGKTNPSGRLVDTYATEATSAPATINAIGNVREYTNADDIRAKQKEIGNPNKAMMGGSSQWTVYSVQQENIYIGYKYYETRYEDVILNRYGANSTVGAFASANAWNYAEEVSYPFGLGLSYTTFTQEITNVSYDEKTDNYTVNVKVTNTGSVDGKLSVAVYAQTPYGQYEIENGVEKASVNLVGFGKTKSLKANGGNETVSVSVPRYLLASYDANGAGTYILSEGKNYFAVGNDAHDALNNILAKKGATGMYDYNGKAVQGDTKCVYEFETSFDKRSYSYTEYENGGENGAVTRVAVENQFEQQDINYWMPEGQKIKYLTRSDWANTFPTKTAVITATQAMIDRVLKYASDDTSLYFDMEASKAGYKASDFNISTDEKRIDNKLSFIDMKDVPWDDPLWDKFIDQMTLLEMARTSIDNYASVEIGGEGVLNIPSGAVCDGSTGFKNGKFLFGDKRDSCLYTAQSILAGTFNHELVLERGKLQAQEMLYCNKTDNWGLGLDLHRTPFSGRNWEYVSEDPNMTMLVGYDLTITLQENGLIASPKHFVGNDQENFRLGIATFYNEQAFREGSLRGFEGSLRFGRANGTMTSMSRQGLDYTCGSEALITNVLRGEWGFRGRNCADISMGYTQQEYLGNAAAGTEQACMNANQNMKDGQTLNVWVVLNQVENERANGDDAVGSGNMINVLRTNAKHCVWALVHSNVTNGVYSGMISRTITPWWVKTLYALEGTFGALAGISVIMLTLDKFVFNRKNETEEVK